MSSLHGGTGDEGETKIPFTKDLSKVLYMMAWMSVYLRSACAGAELADETLQTLEKAAKEGEPKLDERVLVQVRAALTSLQLVMQQLDFSNEKLEYVVDVMQPELKAVFAALAIGALHFTQSMSDPGLSSVFKAVYVLAPPTPLPVLPDGTPAITVDTAQSALAEARLATELSLLAAAPKNPEAGPPIDLAAQRAVRAATPPAPRSPRAPAWRTWGLTKKPTDGGKTS